MKILQLCKKFPYPLRDGETIAVSYLSKALSELGCEITLLSMNTKKHYSEVSALPAEYNFYKEIHTIEIDTTINVKDAFLNLFSKDSYHVSRFIDPKFKAKLIELLKENEYDVVQLETLYLAPYAKLIKAHSDALVTMRAHNVEFEIWERITRNTKFVPKKLYLNYLTRKLKRFELDHLNNYDYLIAVTEKDLINFQSLGYNNGAIASPIGLESRNYHPNGFEPSDELKICFIGSLDWMPNIEGFKWFIKEVWPNVVDIYPKTQLHVAGRNTPESIRSIKLKNVYIHGEVSDAIKFIENHDVMVVPLFSGSGMRVKILEGMALSKTVITTQLGLEGIKAEDGNQVLIANAPEEFLQKIGYCIKHRDEVLKIGARARKFVLAYYDNTENAKQLFQTYQKLLAQPYPISD